MPKRTTIRRVKSTQVQGEDSWVEFTMPKGKDARQIIKLSQEEVGTMESYDRNANLLVQYTRAWNWVDDDDKPLPQLRDDPNVLDELTIEEITWLGQHVVSTTDAQKN